MRLTSSHIRVLTNYARLASTFTCGLLVVRLLVGLGEEAYGVIALLAVGLGVAFSIREVLASCMLPALAGAYHGNDQEQFRTICALAWRTAALAAAAVACAFALFILALPFLSIPKEYHAVAVWFLVAKGIEAIVCTLFSPARSYCLATERMTTFNAWMTAERAVDLLAAALVVSILQTALILDASASVLAYGILSSALVSSCWLVFTAFIARGTPLMSVSVRATGAKHAFAASLRANGLLGLAPNLYSRVSMLVMNLQFGVFGSLVFGIANQLAYYTRQAAIGLVVGIDAVSARVASTTEQGGLHILASRTTQRQGLVVFPIATVLLVHTGSLMDLWLGSSLETEEARRATIACARLLIVGVAARALSEGWIRVLAGAGKAKLLVRPLVGAALLNPMLAMLAVIFLPESWSFYAVPCILAGILFAVHLVAVPWITARHFDVMISKLYGAMLKPVLVLTVTAPLLFSLRASSSSRMAVSLALFGTAYCGVVWLFYHGRGLLWVRSLRLVRRRVNRQGARHAVGRFSSGSNAQVCQSPGGRGPMEEPVAGKRVEASERPAA